MSVQYNSRFSGKYLELNPITARQVDVTGRCCLGSSYYDGATRSGCTGYFTENLTETCPSPSERGTCCSCSAVTNRSTFDPKTVNGIENDVSKCDCEQKGGQWRAYVTPGIPPDLGTLPLREIKKTCTTVYGIDVRVPKACCYSQLTGGVYIAVCDDVCNVADCAAKGSADTTKTFWSNGRRCLVETPAGGPVATLCTPEATPPAPQLLRSCTQGVDCFAGSLAGTCCTRNYDTETTDCATTTKRECEGWWLSSSYGLASCEDDYCGQISFPLKRGIPVVSTENLNDLQTSTNIFKKLPQPGELYQGGIYIGIFNNYTSDTPSSLLGNAQTGSAQTYTVRPDPFGTTKKRWILIVNPDDYGILPFSNNDNDKAIETSYYDGFYNTYGDDINFYGPNSSTFNTIKGKNINGFIDWYVPSQDEAAFISNELPYNFYIPNGFSSFISNTYYMTSTVWFNRNSNSVRSLQDQSINSNYFVYGHHFGKPTVGKTAIVSRNTELPIRLCRRIYLQD